MEMKTIIEARRRWQSQRIMEAVKDVTNKISMREIAEQELEHEPWTFADIRSDRRTADICLVRDRILWRSRRETPHSLPAIGRFFRRDHTTVLAAVRREDARRSIQQGD